MPFESHTGIRLGHALPVIDHLDQCTTGILYIHLNMSGTGIHRVFHQLLYDRSGTLDHLTLQWVFIAFLLGLCGYLSWLVARPPQPERASRLLSPRCLPLVGVVSGVFSGLFTVGGGLVATPMLVRGFGQRQAAAQGLALALVVPGSLIALTTYARADQVNWSLGAPLALGGLSTISWGVACARRMPERVLRAVFVGFLLVTAGLMWPLS